MAVNKRLKEFAYDVSAVYFPSLFKFLIRAGAIAVLLGSVYQLYRAGIIGGDAIAALVGSMIGASAAVIAARWAVDHSAKVDQRRLCAYMKTVASHLQLPTGDICEYLASITMSESGARHRCTTSEIDQLHHKANGLLQAVSVVEKRMARVEAHAFKLDLDAVYAWDVLEAVVTRLKLRIPELINETAFNEYVEGVGFASGTVVDGAWLEYFQSESIEVDLAKTLFSGGSPL